jgi:hypothetical protein
VVVSKAGVSEESSASKASWETFQEDMRSLSRLLRQHYSSRPVDGDKADVEASLRQMQEAADSLFRSLKGVAKEPEVRAGAEKAARAFGTALAETFQEIADQLDKAVRPKPGEKPPG